MTSSLLVKSDVVRPLFKSRLQVKDCFEAQFLLLKSQRTILQNHRGKLLDDKTPPELRGTVSRLIDKITAFECCQFASLPRLANKQIASFRDVLARPGLPLDVRSSLDICFKATAAIVRSLNKTGSSAHGAPDARIRTPSADGPASADAIAMIVCSICDQQVSVDFYEHHTVYCMMAYRSDERIRTIDAQLDGLHRRLKKMLQVAPWPGDQTAAVAVMLPLLRAYQIVGRVVAITADVPDADIEIGYHLSGITSLARSDVDAGIAHVFAEARDNIAEKDHAANACVYARARLRQTRAGIARARTIEATIADFAFLKLISGGAFGRVFLARKEITGAIYAIKVLPRREVKQKNQVQHVLMEKDILLQFESPWVIKFYYSIIGRNNLYLVMEYVCGGDLYSLLQSLGALSEDVARLYAFQLAHALVYLHSHKIIHRDIKPDNVLINSDGRLKLTDFGLSYGGFMDSRKTQGDEIDAKGIIGTPDYIAPEILLGKSHSFPVDWWALGVLTYEFLTGEAPFHAQTEAAIFENVLRGTFVYPEDVEISDDAKDFINRLLTYDPAHRISGEDVLHHRWFDGLDVDHLEVPFTPEVASVTDTSYFTSRYEFQGQGLDALIAEDIRHARMERMGGQTSASHRGHRPAKVGDDDIASFSAVSVSQLGGQNMERMKKWREEHPADSELGHGHRKPKIKAADPVEAPELPLPDDHRRKKRMTRSSAEDDSLLLDRKRKR
jgi:serine/threonine protein kinase